MRAADRHTIDNATAIRIFVGDLFTAFPLRMIAIAGSMAVVSLSEGIGIALLIPLLTLIGFDAGTKSIGRFAAAMAETFRMFHVEPTLLSVLALFVAVVVVENIVRYMQRRWARQFLADFSMKSRTDLYRAYVDSSWPFWVQKHLGHMASLLTVEATRVETAIYYLTALASESLFAVVLLGLALAVSWQLALLFIAAGGLFFTIARGKFRGSDRSGSNIGSLNNDLQEAIQEHLAAAKFIKAGGLRARSLEQISSLVRKLTDAETRANVHAYAMGALLQPVTALILAVGLYIALTKLHMSGPQVLVILVVFYRVAPKIATVQQMWHGLGIATPAYVAIRADLEAARAQADHNVVSPIPVSLSRDIAVENLHYSHRPDMPVLRGLSLVIPAKATVALVGESGSGKTTLLDLILRLLDPASGSISVDGVPLDLVETAGWRRQIGYVAQDSVLFFDTIRENIRWAKPLASEEEVERAARLAFAHDFITLLPKGYDTTIGARGVLVSGGERQRIALARALILEPRLLILDEATSNLDAASERLVQDAIDRLRSRMTIVIVAHRLVTVRNADRIYVLAGGRVVQEGTWNELTEAAGPFAELWSLQSNPEPRAAATPSVAMPLL